MACEVDHSPFADTTIDDDWMKAEDGNGSLNDISDFNSNFGHQSYDTINPSLTYSNHSTPATSDHHAYTFNATANSDLNQTLSPQPTYEAYPSSFNNAPETPYFSSVEMNHAAPNHHSLLRNQHFSHRRSVSEPPGMPEQSPITFHRKEHWIGAPVRSKPTALKSLPKHKANRSHPYPAPAPTRKPAKQQPYSHVQQRAMAQDARPDMQRSQTQPLHHYQQYAPTSAPMMSPQHFMSMSPDQLHAPPSSNMMMAANPFIPSTSRVCTPTPIDPSLREPPIPSKRVKRETTLNIMMTVDELRALVCEAVQKAVGGSGDRMNGESTQREQERTEADSEERSVSPKAVPVEEVEEVDAGVGVMKDET